jgi:hypothetical protein
MGEILAFSRSPAYHDAMGNKRLHILPIALIAVMGITANLHMAASLPVPATDPSGVWESAQGSLSLMLAGEELAFSYTAVFGAAAHICEGAGMAKLAKDGSYVYRDSQGSVVFLVTADEIRLQPGEGIASFCGANWPGDKFVRDKFKAVRSRRVTSPRAYLHTVGPLPPAQGRAFVSAGHTVETVPVQDTQGKDWVLARYKGPKNVTAGFLRSADLD